MLYRPPVGQADRQAEEALLQEPAALQEVRRGLQAAGQRRTGREAAEREVRLARGRLQEGPQGGSRVAPGYPALRMATCLVTGGSGFLGSHLCDALLAKGHR